MQSRNRIISTAAAVTLASGLAVGSAVAFAATTAPPTARSARTTCPTTTTPTVPTTDARARSGRRPPLKPDVKGTTLTKEPASLPFTGGEFALMATAGAVALGGGTALVVASRRRRTAA